MTTETDKVGRPKEDRRFCPFMLFKEEDRQDIMDQKFGCRKDWCEWFDQEMDCCAVRSTPKVMRTFSFMTMDKLDSLAKKF